MKRIILLILAVAIPSSLCAFECATSYSAPKDFVINYDLDEQQDPSFSDGCFITIDPNHHGWGSNQNPSLWTQVGLRIPEDATAAQIVSAPYFDAQVMYAFVQCNMLYFALQYWDAAFKAQILWQYPKSNNTKSAPINACDANVYTPPFPGKNCVGSDFNVTSEVREPRLPGFQYCYCDLNMDHRGWSGNEPPPEWVRIRTKIPKGAIAAQLTSWGANQTLTPGIYAYIWNATANCNELDVALQYWNKPWRLSVGFKLPGNQTLPEEPELECDAYVYLPPHV